MLIALFLIATLVRLNINTNFTAANPVCPLPQRRQDTEGLVEEPSAEAERLRGRAGNQAGSTLRSAGGKTPAIKPPSEWSHR